jgi:hypothetical protein
MKPMTAAATAIDVDAPHHDERACHQPPPRAAKAFTKFGGSGVAR